jgi:hypothetical protein
MLLLYGETETNVCIYLIIFFILSQSKSEGDITKLTLFSSSSSGLIAFLQHLMSPNNLKWNTVAKNPNPFLPPSNELNRNDKHE